MLGDSSPVLGGGGGGDAVATVASAAASGVPAGTSRDGGESVAAAAGSNSGEDIDRGKGEEGDRSFGGNRWPRQETLALLKIRQDMDVAFRDASVKGPLWEDVSRKLAELGYHRSAKKCKEKFENVYKYHKRTKEGRSGKSEGKTYRFFEQIEALENHPPTQQSKPQQPPALPPSKPQLAAAIPATPVSVVTSTSPLPMPPPPPQLPPTLPHVTVPSTITLPAINLTVPPYNNPTNIPSFFSSDPMFSNSSSSSTSSDETTLERQRKRKRKWKDFFERLMKEVIEKQEELQKRFLEAIEKREHERMVREEAWRMQEMARITREREILAQERSIAAAKDAAVMAFLQKIAEQQNLNIPQPPPQPTAPPPPPPPPAPPQPQAAIPQQQVTNMEITENNNNNNNNMLGQSSSRWPKVEVQALIKLRTSMDEKYQENGPKGPLWEEISAAMRKLGYNRNAKRCKEKWENINKYFKKVKESNKRRPEDSKTCPYFHQLDALYREKNSNKVENISVGNHNNNMNMAPLMVRPEQQWPPQQDTRMDEAENEPVMEDEEDDEDKDMGEEEEDEEEEGGGNYEIVASKPASVSAAE